MLAGRAAKQLAQAAEHREDHGDRSDGGRSVPEQDADREGDQAERGEVRADSLVVLKLLLAVVRVVGLGAAGVQYIQAPAVLGA